jgi:hypothetical protein
VIAERGAATVAVDVDESGVRKRPVRSRSALSTPAPGPAVLADKPVGDDTGRVDQCAWHQVTMTSMPRSANAASSVALMALSVMNASESEGLGNEVSVRG